MIHRTDVTPSNKRVSDQSQTHESTTADSHAPDSRTIRSLTIYYQNVRGLRTKTNDLFVALASCDYDVIVFTETWLKDDILDSELTDCYKLYRCDRNSATSQFRRGGGVLIGVKTGLMSTSVTFSEDAILEQTAVCIELKDEKIFLCTVYLPPNSDPALYETHSTCVQQLTSLARACDKMIVLGDYNLPGLCWQYDEDMNCFLPINASTESELALVESMLPTGLQQQNHFVNDNDRLLDLVFTNSSACADMFEPPLPLLQVDRHHKPIVLKLVVENNFVEEESECFDFHRFDFTALNGKIQ